MSTLLPWDAVSFGSLEPSLPPAHAGGGGRHQEESTVADSSKSMVSVVAIIAIVVIVGLAIWFVQRESDSDIEIDLGGEIDAPAWVAFGR